VVDIHPQIIDLLKKEGVQDVNRFVNDLIFLHLQGSLIRANDIAGRVRVPQVYRKEGAEITDVYDEVTHDYQGVEVVGKSWNQSIFIPHQDLYNLLIDHTEVIILKSPRKSGISIKETGEHYYPPPKKDDMF